MLSPLYGVMRNFFLYRCTSTLSALHYCCGIFFESVSYLYEVGRTSFSADFWTFRDFWPQFRENCGTTPNDGNKNCLATLKGQYLTKKRWKQNENRFVNRDIMPVQSISPRTYSATTRSVTKTNKHTTTKFSHLQPARVVRSSPNFAG